MTEPEVSLYECPACHRVSRFTAGAALKCGCEASPLGLEQKFGPPVFGPQRPYYREREHAMIEMPDDGREGVEDLRDSVWLA